MSLLVAASVLLVLGAPQMARADDDEGGKIQWQKVSSERMVKSPKPGNETIPHSGRGWADHGPTTTPADETPSAPVPEPGTMALASLGLMALGASFRKRRAARAAAAVTKD
jgi:hypothetical protein